MHSWCGLLWPTCGEQFEEALLVLVSSYSADEAGQVDAVAAVGAAGGGRGWDERRIGPKGFFSVQAATAAGDSADRAAADAQVRGDLAL